MMQMFQYQTQIFFTHQSTVKEQEQQFLKAQQIEVRNTQQELMDQQRRASTFQSVLSRLPKLSEKSKVASFFHQLEKTLVDHEIPARKWLQALQSSLDGSLVDEYWDTFRQEERDTYETSKCTLMKWCAFSNTECIQQLGVVRMKYSETIQEAFQESINHVKTLSNGDSAEQVRFVWAKARTLAKVKRECAEAVWAKKPATAVELVAAVVDWESIHGRAVKSWGDQNRYHYRQQYQPQQQHQSDWKEQIKQPQHLHYERREQTRPQQQSGQQQQLGERQSGGYSHQEQGQARCYNCGEPGHFKHNCPKPKVQGRIHKIELHLLDECGP